MDPTSARWPGGYDEPFSMRSSPTGATRDSPKGVLGGGGDQSSARDGGVLLPQSR
jgi:hypothetical protein